MGQSPEGDKLGVLSPEITAVLRVWCIKDSVFPVKWKARLCAGCDKGIEERYSPWAVSVNQFIRSHSCGSTTLWTMRSGRFHGPGRRKSYIWSLRRPGKVARGERQGVHSTGGEDRTSWKEKGGMNKTETGYRETSFSHRKLMWKYALRESKENDAMNISRAWNPGDNNPLRLEKLYGPGRGPRGTGLGLCSPRSWFAGWRGVQATASHYVFPSALWHRWAQDVL